MTRLIPRHSGLVVYHGGPEKGFGKIHDALGEEYFFHTTECQGTFLELVEGTLVTFVAGKTEKGPRAYAVRQNLEPQPADVELRVRCLDAAERRGNR